VYSTLTHLENVPTRMGCVGIVEQLLLTWKN
jgi:hypothetical protein